MEQWNEYKLSDILSSHYCLAWAVCLILNYSLKKECALTQENFPKGIRLKLVI